MLAYSGEFGFEKKLNAFINNSPQLFGVTCVCATSKSANEVCNVPLEDSGLFWDGLCFAFLIIQRRLFSSVYFCHVVNETKASLVLAFRGNMLIEEMRLKDMNLEAERERLNIQEIREKIDEIKANQGKSPENDSHARGIQKFILKTNE